jgi:hypothetical protein
VDLIVSPNVVAFNTQSGAHPQGLTPGQTIDALVMQLIDAVTVRVSVAGTAVDLPTPIPLIPGAIVKLAVRGHGTDTKFVIVGLSPRSPVDPAQKPTANAVTSVTIHDPPAAGAGAGIATAGSAVDEDATIANVAPEQVPLIPKTRVADRAVVSDDPAIALGSAMRIAAPRQVGLAPLLADAAKVAALPLLPTPVRQALSQLLSLPSSFAEGASAADIQKSLKQSGVFLEAHLADPRVPFTPASDLKAALLSLRQALNEWVERVPQIAPLTPQEVAVAAATSALGFIKTSIADGRAAKAQGDQGAPLSNVPSEPATPGPTAAVKVPPPPYRSAPTTGQGPAPASIAATAPLETIRDTLIERTEGALARMTLLQSASLGDATGPQQARQDSPPHWNFEVPFMAPPQGAAVAHFEIARDGHNGAAREAKSPVWRANFSINLEPIGPVHAQVAVTGFHASVRLWAERKVSAAALRANSPELRDALNGIALVAAELLVRDGTPPRPVKPPAGRFLDRAT